MLEKEASKIQSIYLTDNWRLICFFTISRVTGYINMALNIATSVEKRATTFALTQEFRNKYNITVNEPAQTHFSVEGVQTYSPEEIKAMAARAGRVSDKAQKEGGYLPLQAYKLDNEI